MLEKTANTGFTNEDFARNPSTVPSDIEFQADLIIDCPVCLYWSERLDRSRTFAPSRSQAIREESHLLGILRQHQTEGACVRRLPYLMELLAESPNTGRN
jgi:hypothetical protein